MRTLLVEHPSGLVLIDSGAGNKEDKKFKDIYGIENEGEGSKTADERHRKEVREFIENEDVEKAAREAGRDVEADEPSYRRAEEEGKRRLAEENEADKDLI